MGIFHMKRLLLVASLVLGAPVFVHAADLPRLPLKAPFSPAPPPFSWTGFYVGINGGYGWGNVKTDDGAGDTTALNSNGGIVGGTFGFNYQINQFVVGFDGDIDWSGMKWSQTATDSSIFGTTTAGVSYKNDTLSTFAARFGVAADRALFYAKAGGAWTNEKFDFNGTDPVFGSITNGSNSFNRLGWMIGAGVEYAVTDMITLKAEYNYADFGTKNETLTINSSVDGPLTSTISDKLTMNVVKVGVNVLFH
jgi:outer membrane immunogenic protein